MILYAESSAILAWVLGEFQGAAVKKVLEGSPVVVTSDLTLLECRRVVTRLQAMATLTAEDARRRRLMLDEVARHWLSIRIDSEVLDRASQVFPVEPVRTLDAIHLATALVVRTSTSDVRLLALDQRIRDCAVQLGFRLEPT